MGDPDTKRDTVADISASMTWKEERRTSRGKRKAILGCGIQKILKAINAKVSQQ